MVIHIYFCTKSYDNVKCFVHVLVLLVINTGCPKKLLKMGNTALLILAWNSLLGPVHMITGQLITSEQLTDPGINFFLGAWCDVCNCSHEFLLAPGQLREAAYPLYNTR